MGLKSCVYWTLFLFMAQSTAAPEYKIWAIRYGTIPQFAVSGLVVGAARDEKMDIPLMFWLIQGGGRNLLLDSGFHRPGWIERFRVTDYIRPDEAVRQAGVAPAAIHDIVLSHAHWDHAGGIDLFPEATVWMQREEFAYYTGPAWQEGGKRGGIDPEDIQQLLRRNVAGKLRLIEGDDREILPGIRVYTGARHTYASQYLRIEGQPPFVLASDNCYLYRNLETQTAIPTFEAADQESNLKELERMIRLAGSRDRVIPGHDPLVFERYPAKGRVAIIK